MFDLNKYCEDFAKDLMNIIYSYDLRNLNEERLNEPGLDLGDDLKGVGVQVTTVKKSEKINNTLRKITADQKKRYKKILILILGIKQETYKGIDKVLAASFNFTEKNIIDITDLEKEIISLPLEKIQAINNFLSEQLIRVYGELGLDRTPSGEAVSILENVETVPTVKFINCNRVINYQRIKYGVSITEEMRDLMNKACKDLFNRLSKLPKVTREFFYVVLSRAEGKDSHFCLYARDEIIRRIINIPDKRYYEEIKLLVDYDLIVYAEEEAHHNTITFTGFCYTENCLSNIEEFANEEKLDLKDILVNLNFSVLACD